MLTLASVLLFEMPYGILHIVSAHPTTLRISSKVFMDAKYSLCCVFVISRNPMVGMINSFSQAGSSILNNLIPNIRSGHVRIVLIWGYIEIASGR
jgi:hypothetical protein